MAVIIVVEKAQKEGITLHYTDMTGRKTSGEKLSYNEFEIENNQSILRCPAKQVPIWTTFNEENKILSAHFNRAICAECPLKERCRVKFQKKDTVLWVSQKALYAEQTRLKITNKEFRREATSKRAAIEGTNSALKRAHGASKLKVRGMIKCKLVLGAKIIAHNFRQLTRFLKGYDRRKKRGLKRNQLLKLYVSMDSSSFTVLDSKSVLLIL